MNLMPFNMNFSIALPLIIMLGMFSKCQKENDSIAQANKTFKNPVFDGQDPWYIKKDNYYYYCFSSNNGIVISKSKYLTKSGEIKRVWDAPSTGWNRSNVWAPELHYIDGRWYIYYAAGESGPPYIYQRSGVLQSSTDDPFSAYTDKGVLYTGDNPDMNTNNIWAIDLSVFSYKDKLYAIWSGWLTQAATDKTSQHLYLAEMGNPYTMKGLRARISSPDQPWETGGTLDLNEGPEALIKDNQLFIVYSCRESWTINYRLGLLKLKDVEGNLLSPLNWEKKGPVFQGPLGVGHCSFATSPDGTEDWIIYHSKKSATDGWQREIFLQSFKWNINGYPDFGMPVGRGVEIDRPSGEYEAEKY
jgi:GH43 family beta-xylosidase